MAFDLINFLQSLKYLNRININFDGLDNQKPYGKGTDLLYMESSICSSLEKLIDNHAKNCFGEDANELKSLYKKLVQIEIRAINGFFSPDADGNLTREASNLKYNYITTLKQIKKFRRFDASMVNVKTGKRLSALYDVSNLAYLNEIRNRVIAKFSMEDLEELDKSEGYLFLAGLLKELKVNNSRLVFNASGAFGRDFISVYEQNYSAVRNFNSFMYEIEDNENKLENVQYYFRDFVNAELSVDGCDVPFLDIDDDFRENLSIYVFCNIFSTIASNSPIFEGIDSKKIEYTPFDKFLKSFGDEKLGYLRDEKYEAMRSVVNKMGLHEPNHHEPKHKDINEPDQVNKKVEAKFKNIIGLADVKQQLKDMLNFCNKLKSIDKFSMKNNHMCFLGNPGTGKTTVARIIARTLFEEGFLKNDRVVEIGGVELKGEYVGQTAPRVKELIKQSEGGILFIDEAYQISEGKQNGGDNFGNDALAVLIKEMEDNPDLMVIFAGYEEQTKRMIKINQGLESRIGTKVMFDNYSTDELIKIAKRIAKENTYKLDASAEKVLRQEIEKHIHDKDFSNGRFVRNLVIKAERIQTRRAQLCDFTLTGEDFLSVIEDEKKVNSEKKKQLGFGVHN